MLAISFRSRDDRFHRYAGVNFTLRLLDYDRYIGDIVIPWIIKLGFRSIHFTVTLDGLKNVKHYIRNIVISKFVVSGFHCTFQQQGKLQSSSALLVLWTLCETWILLQQARGWETDNEHPEVERQEHCCVDKYSKSLLNPLPLAPRICTHWLFCIFHQNVKPLDGKFFTDSKISKMEKLINMLN